MERRTCAECGQFAIVAPLTPDDGLEFCFECKDRSFGLAVGARLICAIPGCKGPPTLVGEELDDEGCRIVLCRHHLDEHIDRFRRVCVLPGDIQRSLCDPNDTAHGHRRPARYHVHMDVICPHPEEGISDVQ